MSAKSERSGADAFLVAAGIFLSRIAGLVRQRAFAHYLGSSLPAAAFQAAFRIPNFLQNLFGEGVLSASFIPVYAELIGRRDDGDAGKREADQVAGAVFGLLALATTLLAALGVTFTPLLVDLIAPGFTGETRALCITLVRILFPGTAVLVMSAWCLGILNSHKRFFLPYAAPVVWNGAIIAALLAFGPRSSQPELATWAAWGTVAGSALQLLVQLPAVMTLLGRFRPSLSLALPSVRVVVGSFAAVVVGRGVVQLSAYLDTAFATLISGRALAALSYAQLLYLLPIGLFGMSVAAVQLASMSRAGAATEALRDKVGAGLLQMAFFVVPSAAAFMLLGDVVAGAVLQTGRFGPGDTRYCWYLLMGSSVGLLAQTMARLYANAFYALKEPRTPLRFAVLRVTLAALGAFLAVTRVPLIAGFPRDLTAVFITAISGLAAWVEFALLRRALRRRVGVSVGLPAARLFRLWAAALAGALAALAGKAALVAHFGADPRLLASGEWGADLLPMPALHPVLAAALLLPLYGGVYFLVAHRLGVPQAAAVASRLAGRLRARRRPSA